MTIIQLIGTTPDAIVLGVIKIKEHKHTKPSSEDGFVQLFNVFFLACFPYDDKITAYKGDIHEIKV